MLYLPKRINQLRATVAPLHMASAQLVAKGGFTSAEWLSDVSKVRNLAGWDPAGKIPVWVDTGNSWVR